MIGKILLSSAVLLFLIGVSAFFYIGPRNVIGVDGRIAYKGNKGPFGFDPNELESWLDTNLKAVASPEVELGRTAPAD